MQTATKIKQTYGVFFMEKLRSQTPSPPQLFIMCTKVQFHTNARMTGTDM